MVIPDNLPALALDGALFLDFDGTLVEIAGAPDQVVVPATLTRLLARLGERLGGALAIVSGRPIVNLEQHLAPLRLPCAGLHGLERRRPDGTLERAATPGWMADLRPAFDGFARHHPGVRVEDKGLSLALHYRAAPAAARAARQFVDASAAALDHEAVVQPGKMVVELRPAGRDKGAAIAAFMQEAPFRGRVPVYLGDDLTDEPGFETVNRRGGLSIRIGSPGKSAATWALASVEAARAWLAQSLEQTGT